MLAPTSRRLAFVLVAVAGLSAADAGGWRARLSQGRRASGRTELLHPAAAGAPLSIAVATRGAPRAGRRPGEGQARVAAALRRRLPRLFGELGDGATIRRIPLADFDFNGFELKTRYVDQGIVGHRLTTGGIDAAREAIELEVTAGAMGISADDLRAGLAEVEASDVADEHERRQVHHVRQMQARVLAAETVVYPASGYDAGFAARLFRGASVVVGIDDHPFHDGADPGYIPVFDVPAENATFKGEVDDQGPLVGTLIGSLATNVEGFRLRGVLAIDDGEKRHGVIEFDAGPGTPRRRYVHSDGRVDGGVDAWWWRGLAGGGGSLAILVKGAMNTFEDPYVAARLTSLLHGRSGVVVSSVHGGPELPIDRSTPGVAGQVEVELPEGGGFGYGRARAVVTFFAGDHP
jgi:hypothetical protein